MIAGFESRVHVLAQLAAFEHERKGAQNAAHLEAIAGQEAIFRAELESLGEEGDYPQPETHPAAGTLAYVGKAGRGLIIA